MLTFLVFGRDRQVVEPVVLHFLAALIPILRLHDVVGHTHGAETPVQAVAERASFVASEDLAGQSLLLGRKAQQPH